MNTKNDWTKGIKILDKDVFEPYECWIKGFFNPIEEGCYCLVALALIF